MMLSIYVWIWHSTEECSDLEEQAVLTWSTLLPWGEGRVTDERYCFWALFYMKQVVTGGARECLWTQAVVSCFLHENKRWPWWWVLPVAWCCRYCCLRDLGRGSLWLLVDFGAHCMLHCPVLCRGINWVVRRDAALRLCGLSSQSWKTYCVWTFSGLGNSWILKLIAQGSEFNN